LGIAVNKATSQQCRSYLYIKEDSNSEKNETTPASSPSSCFSLCEIQSIPCDYGAFLLRQTPSSTSTTTATTIPMIVGDGSLYTVTRMDPLFFLLTADRLVETGSSSSVGSVGSVGGVGGTSKNHDGGDQWQPLEQILDALQDPTLVSCLQSNPKQLKHLYDELNLDDDKNDRFYKFSVSKALIWLTRKQEAIQQVLLQQQLEKQAADDLKKKKATAETLTTVGGSFCSTFNMIQDNDKVDMTQKTSTSSSSLEQQQQAEAAATLRSKQEEECRLQRQETRAREESIQIVCNYLVDDNASWKGAFLKHLQVYDDNEANKVLWGKTTSSSISISSNNNNNKRPATTTATFAASTKLSGANSINKSSSSATTAGNNNANKKLKQTAKSTGVKRLEKAALGKNKGMQKMTSFFQAIPKKKQTKENTNINDQK
jgi:hypothetical protein